MNAKPTTRNWRYILVMLVVRGFYMPGALAISFTHILTAGHMLGLTGWQAWTTPFFIDGFALIGMIMRSRTFAAADIRRFGLRLQIAAGAGSLAANIAAGHTTGERIYGALVVAGLVIAELAGERLHAGGPAATVPITVEVIREVIVEVPAAPVVDEAEAKRVARRERDRFNRAVKTAAAKLEAARVARDAELVEMAAGFVPADAPVSPAPGEAAAYL
jgi:hypothetical protein